MLGFMRTSDKGYCLMLPNVFDNGESPVVATLSAFCFYTCSLHMAQHFRMQSDLHGV